MSCSCREALADVREALPVVREALPAVREWLGDLPGCPGEVGRPSRMSLRGGGPIRLSERGRLAVPDFRE